MFDAKLYKQLDARTGIWVYKYCYSVHWLLCAPFVSIVEALCQQGHIQLTMYVEQRIPANLESPE